MTVTAPHPTTEQAVERRASPGVDLCLLLLVALSASASNAVGQFLQESGLHQASAALAASTGWTRPIDDLASTAWLAALLYRQRRAKSWLAVCCTLLLGLTALSADLVPGDTARVVHALAFLAVVSWLTLKLCTAHGADVQPLRRLSRAATSPGREWALALLIACTLMAYAWATSRLVILLTAELPQSLPVMHTTQAAALGWHGSRLVAVTNAWWSAVLEEGVMVGAVCVLGRAARWPLWLIYVVSLGLRMTCHLYFGVPALGLVILGVASVALYLTRGRLLPLVLGHAAYDLLMQFL